MKPKKKNKLSKLEKAKAKRERKAYNKQEDLIASDLPIFDHRYRHKSFYCPMCNKRFDTSDYLTSVFRDDERALWLSNMVMHYRHNHITSWNKYWGRYGWYYRQAAHFGDYDEEKAIVNERAKRQIARKCPKYIIANDINKDVYSRLQGTTAETISTVEKIWAKN